ncbi:hypothetical protein Tco_0982984 [Tanacetum coccineum]
MKNKICKKNDVKAQKSFPHGTPNCTSVTFKLVYAAQSMFIALKIALEESDDIKKTQKALLKQQVENSNATSSESLDFYLKTGYKMLDGGGFDWSVMEEDEIQATTTYSTPLRILMAFSDSEHIPIKRSVNFKEAQDVRYKESEVQFSESECFVEKKCRP